MGPADGVIDWADYEAAVAQYGHSCQGESKIGLAELSDLCDGNLKEAQDPLDVSLVSGESYKECRIFRDVSGIPFDAVVIEMDAALPEGSPGGAGSGNWAGSCTGHNRARHPLFHYTLYDLWLRINFGAVTDPENFFYTFLSDNGVEWGNTARYPFSLKNKISSDPAPNDPPHWTNFPWEFDRQRWADLNFQPIGQQAAQSTLLTRVTALWSNDRQAIDPDFPPGPGPICAIGYQT